MKTVVCFLCLFVLATSIEARDLTFQGFIQPEQWRFALGAHSESFKLDWFRQEANGKLSDGYDLVATEQFGLLKTQYKQSHKSAKKLDVMEASVMGTLRGVGIGVARTWFERNFQDPNWMAKANYTLDKKRFALAFDYSNNFKDRRMWSVAPRLKIPAWRFVSLTLSGKYEKVKKGSEVKEWPSAQMGLAIDLDALTVED